MENAVRRVFGYIRVSTDKQENGADAQEKRIRAQSLLKNFELADVITDVDEFSGDLNRPGMQKVLTLVREKKIDVLIVCKLDRMTRSTRDAIDLIDLFRRKNVELISISESLDTESPMGRFFIRMMASIAELERELIGTRTSEGLQNLKSQGYPAGPAPFGYTAQKRTDEERLLKIRKALVENPTEQDILGLIGKWKDNMSCQVMADKLNAKGYHTRKSKAFPEGGPWNREAVRRVVLGLEGKA